MIKVTRGRKITFNPVQFESIEVFASITQEIPDDSDPSADTEWYDDMLTDLLAPEVDAAAMVTTNSKSIVHEYRFTEKKEEK